MAFEAARRQKSTSTKIYRANFAASCYRKFAKQLKTEGKFDEAIDVEKSRDLRFKFSRAGKNLCESVVSRKIAEVKREVMNVILPIYEKQIPQGVPPNGIQWEEVMETTKNSSFNLWKKGKKRYENMDAPDSKWSNVEWDVFEYLGPRGKDLASLKIGSLDDDDTDLDTCRETTKKGTKAMKKMNYDDKVEVKEDAKSKSRSEITAQLQSHTRMASMRLVMQYGTVEQ